MVPTLDVSSPALALWSALVVGFLFGVVPIGLAEVSALAIGAVRPPGLALAMLALFTVAHVGAKVIWYYIGSWADRVRHERLRRSIVRAREVIAKHPGYGAGVLAASALTSVPPFHLAAIAAGIARIPLARFIAICLAGRLVRFALFAAAAPLVELLAR